MPFVMRQLPGVFDANPDSHDCKLSTILLKHGYSVGLYGKKWDILTKGTPKISVL